MAEQPTGLAKMREPFAPNQISKLCRSTKKDNPKASCRVCGGYHGQPSIALDYVGHAALTDRLLDCDPQWSWEPLSFDATGSPLLDRDGGMWIKLTVCGVTRLGYGDAQGKSGGDAMKERIGDALRNAAMRFGAALDLWHKGELHVDEDAPKPEQKPPAKKTEPVKPTDPPSSLDAKDAEHIERIKKALKFIYGEDRATALNKVEELTAFIPKGKAEADRVAGVRDFTKLRGQRLTILCHNLEKIANTPKEEKCSSCFSPLVGGRCHNEMCDQGEPPDDQPSLI